MPRRRLGNLNGRELRLLMLNLLTITFLLTLLAVGLVWVVALRWRLLDHPNARSFHQRPTPRMGGSGCCSE